MPGLALPAVALLLAVALAACGGSAGTVARKTSAAHGKKPAPHVDIYAGLPLRGPMAPEGRAILKGIQLELRHLHPRPDDLSIEFHKLNDSGRKSGDENLKLAADNAGKVATDPSAVFYIGDVGSAEADISAPILNAAGIAQVTPGDPFIPTPTTQSGSTAPAPAPRLLRLLPDDTVQAAADLLFFKQIPPDIKAQACARVVAFAQDDPESAALVDQMYLHAKADGIEMPKPTLLAGKSDSLTSQQTTALHDLSASPSTAPCGFVIAGSESRPAVKLTKIIHIMDPRALIVGTSGLCEPDSKWTKAAVHGVQAVVGALLWCTSPVLPIDKYTGGESFLKLYKAAYGVSQPSPYSFYGYEAADLGSAMIDNLGTEGDNRSVVRSDLFDTEFSDQVFSPYGSLTDGDSTLSSYGVYGVSPTTAEPSFYAILKT